MRRIRSTIPLLLLVFGCGPCAADAADAAQAEYFERRIRPLLAEHCNACHSKKSGAENGELVLETIAGIAAGGSRGPVLSPGKPDESLLMQALRYSAEDLQMPPEGKLPDRELHLVEEWIRQGAVLPEYHAEAAADGEAAAGIDFGAGRRFWAFQPLQRPRLPKTAHASWVRRPLDAFVFRELQAAALTPSAAADRRTFLRRLTFDLTGLPPTPDELDAFARDPAPDAELRVVQRLLNSPAYGERWGRFWLDLARYTDTTAAWLASTAQAWLYRDWVVTALNQNRPIDEFIRLQLAADFAPDAPPEDLAALGFLGLSPNYWKELRLAPDLIERVVADEWDERIDTVSRTFLGLTVSCARCHDHKFDPISMEDYYALAGVFASCQLAERPLLPDSLVQTVDAAQQRVAELESRLQKMDDKQSAAAARLREQIEEIRGTTPQIDAPRANVVREASVFVLPEGDERTRLEYRDEPRNVALFRRGNPSNPGAVVPRRFLQVLSTSPEPFQNGSGRGELAEALLTEARALTARVFVNRIWEQHFGTGLVRTLSNFGTQGDRPSHPELLEYLAAEFLAHGWDLKWLHREIVLSATYRQASVLRDDAYAVDPENRLLWRMTRRRLDVEMWRDAMLAAAGSLDRTLGGPAEPLDDVRHSRRTLYGRVARRDLNQMLRLYDFPEPTAHSPHRAVTTTPLQQLYMFNSPFVERQAAALAQRVQSLPDTRTRIDRCYELLFARLPTAAEMEAGLTFLQDADTSESGSSEAGLARWTTYTHALLGLNEFLFVD